MAVSATPDDEKYFHGKGGSFRILGNFPDPRNATATRQTPGSRKKGCGGGREGRLELVLLQLRVERGEGDAQDPSSGLFVPLCSFRAWSRIPFSAPSSRVW
jgi:hypothetical protein